MIQETMFEAPTAVVKSAMEPPEPPGDVMIAEPLGQCCKAGCDELATRRSPSGALYCAEHGKCGGKSVRETALGIEMSICGRSVEEFVLHPRMGIWVCTCVGA